MHSQVNFASKPARTTPQVRITHAHAAAACTSGEGVEQWYHLYPDLVEHEAGYDDAHVQDMVDQCWVWRNIYVSDTDEKAERIGIPAFTEMLEHRKKMRERTERERGTNMSHDKKNEAPAARTQVKHSLLCGSPATVAEEIARIKACNAGGLILTFRLGPMAYEDAAHSIELFMNEVAPEFPAQMAAE